MVETTSRDTWGSLKLTASSSVGPLTAKTATSEKKTSSGRTETKKSPAKRGATGNKTKMPQIHQSLLKRNECRQ